MSKRQPVRRSAADDPRWTSHVAPAPGEAKIVQAFVNTAVPRTRTEELSSPQALARWLERWRLMGEAPELTADDLERAIALREGMRALLWGNNGRPLDPRAIARLDQAAADVPLRLRAGADGGVYLTSATGGAGALARLLGIFAAVRLEDSWPRFKACADRTCGSAFYDVTKNLSGRWCSPRCSNRISARAYRRRHGSSY